MAFVGELFAASGCPNPMDASSPDWAAVFTAIATVVTAVAAVSGAIMARAQIAVSNSIRRTELISATYNAFADPRLTRFYRRIRERAEINWKGNPVDEELLNRSLTVFDGVSYLKTQNLFEETAWEYVASEILYFALNPSVWGYMAYRIEHARERGFPDDIVPFTGYYDLYDTLRRTTLEHVKAKPFPEIPSEYRALFESLKFKAQSGGADIGPASD